MACEAAPSSKRRRVEANDAESEEHARAFLVDAGFVASNSPEPSAAAVADAVAGPAWLPNALTKRRRSGCTPMFVACKAGKFEVSRWLFAHGAASQVRTRNDHGMTPMMASCEGGHLGICKWLFANGAAADVTTRDSFGYSPLQLALQSGHFDVCEWLFEQGALADVWRASNNGWTSMHDAAVVGQVAGCRWLVDHGGAATTRAASRAGDTPLHLACWKGHLAVGRWLVEHGGAAPDVWAVNAKGETPLSLACAERRLHVCQWLLRVGGAALLANAAVPRSLTAQFKTTLDQWLAERVATHRCFVRVVLFGTANRLSGSRFLWMLGGEAGLRMLVAQFVGVEVGRDWTNLVQAAWALQVMHLPEGGESTDTVDIEVEEGTADEWSDFEDEGA